MTFSQTAKEQLLSKTENAYNPIPSPDGTKIAYIRTGWGRNYPAMSLGRSNLITEVKVMDSEGRILTEKPLADTFLAGWTPDGKNLICYRDYKYFLVSLEGKRSKEIQIPYEEWS
jgi:Tol biopolymer transport system component